MILNKQTKFILFFACFVILLILSLCVNTFYWADDYAFIVNLNKNGILQNCIEGYLTWDGRMLTLGAFVQGFFLKNLSIELITFFWSLCFLGSGFLIFYIINQELKFQITNKFNKILVILMLIIVSWLSGFIHFSETVYWGTGGCYSFALLLGAIWVLLFLRIQDLKIGFFQKILFLIFSIIVGGTTQNLTIALLTLIVIYLIYNYLKKINSINNFNFLILISILSGLSFIMLAPGNAMRLETSGLPRLSDITFFMIFRNILFVSFYYLCYSILGIFLSIVVAFGIFNLLNPFTKFDKLPKLKFPKNKESWIDLMFDFKWLLVSLSTILPFILITNLMAKRTVIFFVYFMIVFTITFCLKTFQKTFQISNEINELKKFSKATFSFFVVLVGTTVFTIYNFKKGVQLKKIITERENLFKNSKGNTVFLKLIDQNLTSPCYHFTDFFIDIPDKDNFIKTSQEEFFDVKIIIEK